MPMLSSSDLRHLATIQWPHKVNEHGQTDWIGTIEEIECWLEDRVGPGQKAWWWNSSTLDHPYLCSINFLRDSDRVLFLLRWG